MLRDRNRKQVCAVYIDAPKLADSLNGVVDCCEVLGEAGGCDEVVDLTVLGDDLGDGCFDGFLGGYVGVVCCYFWNSGLLSTWSVSWV